MAKLSLFAGVVSLAGLVYLALTQAQSGFVFWSSGGLAVVAIVLGVPRRSERAGMFGMALGILDLLAVVLLFWWLSF